MHFYLIICLQLLKMNFKLFVFILFLFMFQAQSSVFPNIIWMYWNVGQDMSDSLAKACFTRIKQISRDWEPRLVEDSTIKLWLNQAETKELKTILERSKIKQTPQGNSYFLRLMLLKKYGGVWLDAHTILLQKLDWLQDIKKNPEVLNKLGSYPQAFMFFKNDKAQLGYYEQFTENQTTLYPTIQMEFSLIASVPQSQYIKDLLAQLKNMYQGDLQYFKKIKATLGFKDEYTEYWTLHLANTIIRFRQLRLYQENIKKISLNLQNAFYKVWTISRVKGPFYLALQIEDKTNVNVLFRNTGQTYNQPKYMIKLNHFNQWQKVYKYMINQPFRVDFHARKSNPFIFDYGEMYLPQYFQCLYKPYIYQDSIINKFVIQGSSIPYYETLKVYKKSELPRICRQTHLQSLYNHKQNILKFLYIPFLSLVLIELFTCFNFYLAKLGIRLKCQKLCETNSEEFKMTLYFIANLFYVVLLHYYYIKAQTIMYWYGSPYSIFICSIYIGFILFCMSYYLLSKQKIIQFKVTFQTFLFIVLLGCLLQLLLLQKFGIWNFSQSLFHFQTLVKTNKQNLFQVINGLWKMSLMFLVGNAYFKGKQLLVKIKQKYFSKNGYQQQLKQLFQKYYRQKRVDIFQNETLTQQQKSLTPEKEEQQSPTPSLSLESQEYLKS